MDYAQRQGKSALLNSAIAETGGEILVLSDANTEYQPDAIKKLVRWFADPRVDVVCGRLLLKDPAGGRNVDSLYWRYETFLKNVRGEAGRCWAPTARSMRFAAAPTCRFPTIRSSTIS